ncbi:MAG: DMT family protein [Bacteroidaceae bacterium]|nr:DMT family protein [Bacteroidaceae bacterium]
MRGLSTVLLLILSNIFMTLAWYGNLKLQQMNVTTKWPLFLIIVASWGVAFFEYCLLVPANRIGSNINGGPFSLFQLKVIQEVISLIIFTIIITFMFQGEHLQWNHAVSFIFIVLAVVFMFMK